MKTNKLSDQSTQANLSPPRRSRAQRLHKSTQIPSPAALNWAHLRQNVRPKPMDVRLGISNPEFRISLSPSEMNLNSSSKYSFNSSFVNHVKNGLKTGYLPYIPRDEESSSCSCRCRSNEEIGHFKTIDIHGKQGLSWRQLHMSRAKLKATSATSELLSGFAMVAMVELQINEPTTVPEWLFVLFAVCTTVLVSVHIFALMISTYILPNIDAIAKMEICEMIIESPHERMRGFIEIAWAFSTVLGLFLFLVEVAILSWVKFWDYSFPAAIAATVIVIPMLIIFVLFAIHFYHSLVVYKCDASMNDMSKLEDMKKHLDEFDNPV